MTENDYTVRGCTALIDAIGGAIHHIGNIHKYSRPEGEFAEYRQCLCQFAENNRNKENFISAVRKFMWMKELTPALLHKLIERIEVYEKEGTGKNRTQRIMNYYRFVGYIEISGGDRKHKHTAETRKGVAIKYLTA